MTRKEFGTAYVNGCTRTVRFLLSRGLSEDEAKETAQAAWVRGWERRNQIRDSERTLTWVNSIALNLYRSQRRRDHRHGEMQEFPVPPSVSLLAIDVKRMLKEIRSSERELLEKRYFFGYEIEELALEQGCSETAVRVRLLRARRHLRHIFEERNPVAEDYFKEYGKPDPSGGWEEGPWPYHRRLPGLHLQRMISSN